MNKLIRVNRNEVVMVLRVDQEKGYIDLSKRRVDPEGVTKCEDRFNKAKAVHRVLRQVAELRGVVLKSLYQQVPPHPPHARATQSLIIGEVHVKYHAMSPLKPPYQQLQKDSPPSPSPAAHRRPTFKAPLSLHGYFRERERAAVGAVPERRGALWRPSRLPPFPTLSVASAPAGGPAPMPLGGVRAPLGPAAVPVAGKRARPVPVTVPPRGPAPRA